MHRGVLLLSLALPPSGLYGQQPVTGRVYDAATGAPLARAALTLAPEDAALSPSRFSSFFEPGALAPAALPAAITGPDGSFRFPAVVPGRYRLSARRRGYLDSSLDQHGALDAAIVVTAANGALGIRFPLEPDATLEGHVQDSSGDPVNSGTVTLFRQTDDGAAAIRSFRSASLSAEDDGSSYRFSDLPPGTYYLAVTTIPWFATNFVGSENHPSPLDVAYPVTYYDGATSTDNAQPITLLPGTDFHADMTLQAVPAVHLRVDRSDFGPLFPEMTSPAFGSQVSVSFISIATGSSEPGHEVQGDMAVAPGTYTLAANGGRRTLSLNADQTVSTDELFPPSPRTVVLSGELGMASGATFPAGVRFTLAPFSREAAQRPGFRDRLGQARETGYPGSSADFFFHRRPVEVTLGPHGRFQAAVLPGEYRLEAEQRDGSSLLVTGAAATGATLSSALTISVTSSPVLLAATLAVANSSLSGSVRASTGTPEPGVMILLVPHDLASTALYRQTESATDGSWQISGLAAGSYRVVAIRDGWDLAWQTPSVLAPYLRDAATVTLQPGMAASLAQPLVPVAR